MKNNLKSKLTRFHSDRTGAVTVTAAIWLSSVAIVLASLGIDGANLYRVRNDLQQSSDRAAVAGAAQLVNSQTAATSTAKEYSSDTSTPGANAINGVASVTATATASCVWSILPGNPKSATTCPGSGANVITVTQTATVNFFLGLGSTTVTASSAAASSGGSGGLTGPLDVVIILDTTQSMNDCENGSSGCSAHTFTAPITCPPTTPSWFSSTTKVQAAEFAVQTLLCSFQPASGNVGTQAALMVFPGMVASTSFSSQDYCGTGAWSKLSDGPPATCTGTGIVSYACSPGYSTTSTTATYLLVPFSSDFKTSSTATTLNSNSNLVKAVGGSSSCRGLQAPGGQSTYYAGALAAAQAYLAKSGRSTAQKVIFLLSDGDANASSSSNQISSSQSTNQCQQAVTNADAAATAGTWVFAFGYDSLTSGTCATDTGTYKGNACLALQNIASSPGNEPDSSKFFAFNGTGSGATCSSKNVSLPTLAATFEAAWQNLTAARLININCTTSETCNL